MKKIYYKMKNKRKDIRFKFIPIKKKNLDGKDEIKCDCENLDCAECIGRKN